MLKVVFVRFSGHAAYGNAVKLNTEKGKHFVQGKDTICIIFGTVGYNGFCRFSGNESCILKGRFLLLWR